MKKFFALFIEKSGGEEVVEMRCVISSSTLDCRVELDVAVGHEKIR